MHRYDAQSLLLTVHVMKPATAAAGNRCLPTVLTYAR
jgi:predicted secreted Zn-dependent protease